MEGRDEGNEAYDDLVIVGEGTYGKVYKARCVKTNSLVALKRIRLESEKQGVTSSLGLIALVSRYGNARDQAPANV